MLFVGDIQIPAETVELMFETAGIEPAAGPAGGADGAHGGYEDLGPQSVGDGFRQNSLLGDTGLPGAGAQGGDQVAGNTVPKFPAGGIIVTLSEEGLKDANGNDIGNRDGIGIPDDQTHVPQVLNIGFGLVDGEGNDLSYSMLGPPSVNWTSGGNLITWALNAAGTELVGSTIDGEAIVVSFDNTTDSYTVTLLKPLDHPNKAGEDRRELALDIRVRDYQNWNDGKLILRIEDDSPEETTW